MVQPIRFEDGAAYERMMGIWSRIAGSVFLDWLAPRSGLRWVDIGCGNGAFTEMIVERCAPAEVQGIDPSEGQLAYARTRLPNKAQFRNGHAMALPFPADSFDVATMALVIFFVPDPAKGVAEMARVVAPGGTVAIYAWDIPGGGFPLKPIWDEMQAIGEPFPTPPSSAASAMDALRKLWADAGLTAIETREIAVQRTFASFDEFWSIAREASVGPALAAMAPDRRDLIEKRLRARLPADAAGRITLDARANAIKGRVPG